MTTEFYQGLQLRCGESIDRLTDLREWLPAKSLESETLLDSIKQAEEFLSDYYDVFDIVIEEECPVEEALEFFDYDLDNITDDGMYIIDSLTIDDELETVFCGIESVHGSETAEKHYDTLQSEFEERFRKPVVSAIGELMDHFSNLPH